MVYTNLLMKVLLFVVLFLLLLHVVWCGCLQDFVDADDNDRASKKGGSGFFRHFRDKLHKGNNNISSGSS